MAGTATLLSDAAEEYIRLRKAQKKANTADNEAYVIRRIGRAVGDRHYGISTPSTCSTTSTALAG